MKNVHGVLQLEAKSRRDVFVLFAALNALGYDDENNAEGMSRARKRIRNVLSKYDWRKRYPQLERAAKAYHPWHLLRAVLARPQDTKKTSMLGRFLSDLRTFAREPVVQSLWKRFKPYQTKEGEKLFPLFVKEATKLIAFIGRPPRGRRTIILIANPLDAYWSGYAVDIEGKSGTTGRKVSCIVVGPGAEKNHGGPIRHELLHILAPRLRLPRRIATARSFRRLARMGYASQRIINREYVVRALNFLYESEVLQRDVSEAIKHEEKDFPRMKQAMASVRVKKERGRLVP